MTASPVLARRALARLAFIIVIASALVALAKPARADDPLSTFFAQVFQSQSVQKMHTLPPVIVPLRRHMRERAQGTMVASFYGAGERLAKHTANGEVFRPGGMTAAHRSLRFGQWVRVTDIATGRTVDVRITDRGPSLQSGRGIDLSFGAASRLGIIKRGIARVTVALL